MPVWTDLPRRYRVVHPTTVHPGETLRVAVYDLWSQLLAGHRVTVTADGTDDLPGYFRTRDTDPSGWAAFTLPTYTSFTQLRLVVSYENYIPYDSTMHVE